MKYIAIATFTIAIFFGVALLGYKNYFETKVSTVDNSKFLVRDFSPIYGDIDAKVTLVEFFDPACETCAQFYPLIKDLVKNYDGKLKVVYRYASLHEGSDFVVALIEASKNQDAFFPTLEFFFKNIALWTVNHQVRPNAVVDLLKNTDLNITQLFDDIENEELIKRINQSKADSVALGISKTPSFFVNGKPLITFGYSNLVELIESEMKVAYK